jgi:hypothetical protein
VCRLAEEGPDGSCRLRAEAEAEVEAGRAEFREVRTQATRIPCARRRGAAVRGPVGRQREGVGPVSAFPIRPHERSRLCCPRGRAGRQVWARLGPAADDYARRVLAAAGI